MIWLFIALGLVHGIAFYFNESWDINGNDVLALVNVSDDIYASSTLNPYWVNGTFSLPIYNLNQVGDVYAGCEFSGIGYSWFFLRNISLEWYNRTLGAWQSVCSLTTFLSSSDRWIVCNVSQFYYYDIENFQTYDGTTTYFRCNINGGIGSGTVRIDRLAAAAYAHICVNLTDSAYYIMEYDLYGATINVTTPYTGKACINIQASNLVLDCRNHTISAIGEPVLTYGVLANDVTNVTLVNCNITNYTFNAFFNNYATDIKVFNSSFDLAENASLAFNWETTDLWIENNSFNNSLKGIWFLNNVRNAYIFNNTFNGDDTAILIYNLDNLTVWFNRFMSNTWAMRSNLLTNSTFHSNTYQGDYGNKLYQGLNVSFINETFNMSIESYVFDYSSEIRVENWTSISGVDITGYNSSNITIKNGECVDTDAFLDVNYWENFSVENVVATGFAKLGVRTLNGQNIWVNNLTLIGNLADYGMFISASNITINNTSITSVLTGIFTTTTNEQNLFNSFIYGFDEYGVRLVTDVENSTIENTSVYSGGAASVGVETYDAANILFQNITLTALTTGASLITTNNLTLANSSIYTVIDTALYSENTTYLLIENNNIFDSYRGLWLYNNQYVNLLSNLFYNMDEALFTNQTYGLVSEGNTYFNNNIHCNITLSNSTTFTDLFENGSIGCVFIDSDLAAFKSSFFLNHTHGILSQNSTIYFQDSNITNGTIGIKSNASLLSANNLTIQEYMLGLYGLESVFESNLLNITAMTGGYWWDGELTLNSSNIEAALGWNIHNSTIVLNNLNNGQKSLWIEDSQVTLENSTLNWSYMGGSTITIQNITSNLTEIGSSQATIANSYIAENPIYGSVVLLENITGYNVSLLFSEATVFNTTYTESGLGMSVAFSNGTINQNLIENNTEGLFLAINGTREKSVGMAYVDWNNQFPLANVSKDIERIKWMGMDSVDLVVQLVQTNNTSSDVQLKPGTSLTNLQDVVDLIKSQGLRVCIYPLLLTSTGQWRGYIRPDDLDTWFANYETVLLDLAALSPDCLYVGSEYVLLENETTYWNNLIADIRAAYSGPLYYGFNWYDALYLDSYLNATWAYGLDGWGLSFYAPLADCTDPFDLTLFATNLNTDIYPRIEGMHNASNLPIFFSEIGYRDVNGAYCEPYAWQYDADLQNLTQQALLHVFMLNQTKGWPEWFKGESIWYYEVPGVFRWDGYGIRDKEAEYAIRDALTGGPSFDGYKRMQDNGVEANFLALYQWMIQTQDALQTYGTDGYINASWGAMLEKPAGTFSLSYGDIDGNEYVIDISLYNDEWWLYVSENGVGVLSQYLGPFTPGIHRYAIEVVNDTAYVVIDEPVTSFTVGIPYKFGSWIVVSSWDASKHASIVLYNVSLSLINPDTDQEYLAYYNSFLGGVMGWLYYQESETLDPLSGTLLLLDYSKPNVVEKQALGINQPTNPSFYNNSICFNSFDVYSTFNFSNGELDRCDLFAHWWELGRPGCTRTCSRVWQYVYGNVNYSIILAAQNDTSYLGEWPSLFNNGTIMVTDYDAVIHWDQVVALTRDNTNTFVSGNNDFLEADIALGLTAYPPREQITTKWGGTSASVPLETLSFNILGNVVDGVPVAPSSPGATAFKTGIMWDSYYNTEYTGAEPLIFVTYIQKNTTDLYGQYDYLITVPYTLALGGSTNDVLAIYVYVE